MYGIFTYTFTHKLNQMQVNMPYIECLGYCCLRKNPTSSGPLIICLMRFFPPIPGKKHPSPGTVKALMKMKSTKRPAFFLERLKKALETFTNDFESTKTPCAQTFYLISDVQTKGLRREGNHIMFLYFLGLKIGSRMPSWQLQKEGSQTMGV